MTPSKYLCQRLGFSYEQLFVYSTTCPRRYKKYKIKKRRGGFREIAQPAKNLKVIQRILINEFLQKNMPIHDAATAYRKGKSILDNASPHLQNSYLLKMDFENFFPSITSEDFTKYCKKNSSLKKLDQSEIDLLISFFFMHSAKGDVLSIGAPSSPFLSNAFMFEFDTKISSLASTQGVTYTRYSDDLTYSSNIPDRLFDWPKVVAKTIKSIDSPKLSLNKNKTVFSSKKHNRHITGVTISNDGKASLGRQRKREIRTRIFLLQNGKQSKKEIHSLRGMVAFANVVESEFIEKLTEKYPLQMKILYSHER